MSGLAVSPCRWFHFRPANAVRSAACGLVFLYALSLTNALSAEDFAAPPLRVPPGYTVELAAAPPVVAHPLMGCFDEQGRLYVAANAGENLPRVELEKRLPNFVQRLEDKDGDGVFERATVFADKMTFPQGCLWHEGSLFVASSGAIWKLTDTDDDGVADERIKLVGDFGYTGNAADVHGPFRGPDGRIYWCEGRHGHEIKDASGTVVSRGKAARIFSCRPDGSDVQTFCTGGMDNPVEILFTPTGEMLGTVNLMYSRPRGDCLVQWQYGGVYPREDFADSLGSEFVRSGRLLTEVHNFGHVALSGLCQHRGTQWGAEFADVLFVTQFNTNRLLQVKLVADGSTYSVVQSDDFLVSSSQDFHPTDVLQDADGSLLVIDTGGWFRIGCPQSQVAKSHIQGAIYRIRRTPNEPPADPWGNQLDWQAMSTAELIERLADFRWAVADRAVATLAGRVSTAEDENRWSEWNNLVRRQSAAARQRWGEVLCRVGTKEALQHVVDLLRDDDTNVRQAAVRTLLYADPDLLPDDQTLIPLLVAGIKSNSPAERCQALATAGRLSAKRSKLLEAIVRDVSPAGFDRSSEHAYIYALISSGNETVLRVASEQAGEATRAAAALALDALQRARSGEASGKWLEIPPADLGQELTADERAQLLKLAATLPAGDETRGRALFASQESACAKCHRVANVGGEVGPDLTNIGRIRAPQDLLESLLYPNASFARGFAPYAVLTHEGKSFSGIILSETATQIRIGIDADHAPWIANDDIEELRATATSIMPADVAKRFTPQQLADLLAYLRSLR